jgi:hypothetical protein
VRPAKNARATQPAQYRTAAISPRRMSPGLVRNESPRLVSSQIKELSSKVDNLRFSTNEKLDEIANYVSDELASMRDKASSNLEQALITNNHLMTLDMLKQEPNKSKLALRIVWRALKPDKGELFQQAWDIVEPVASLLSEDAEYAKWDFGQNHFNGLRHKLSKKKHGLVRTELFFFITESSFKHDKVHGLQVKISSDLIYISLNQEGEKRASFCFDTDFHETRRNDPEGLLEDFSPNDFRRQ